MMVNCPRCGFSQPEDQYCAQCGVDMLNYQPARKPLWRRIAASTIFQVFVLAVVVTLVFSYAREKRQRELAERIAEVESARSTQTFTRRQAESTPPVEQRRVIASNTPEAQTESQSSTLVEDEPEESTLANTDNARAAETTASTTPPAATEFNDGEEEAAVDAQSDMSTTAAAAVSPPQSVRVTFAAASRRAISELITSASNADPNSITSIGPVTLGTVPQATNRLRALQTTEYWQMLDSSSRSVQVGQPVEFYGGQREPTTGHFLGFVVEVTPSDYDEANTLMHLRILRYLREGTEIDVFVVPIPETVAIPRGGGAFVSGALFSKRANSREERQFYDPIKVLHILATEPYRNNLTDLLIFIEPQ